MPIKPENRTRYPADWPAISLDAKVRARWRCQHPGCTARQYAVGSWELRNEPGELLPTWRWLPIGGNIPCDMAGGGELSFAEARAVADANNGYGTKYVVIVLTVAHLNHQPEDCRPENLAAMCQRHHLAYDHQHHQHNAWATRRSRSGNLELFA